MLRWCDQVPADVARIVVAGSSGSGKTTLAGRLAAALGLPHFEIDALHHGPQWQPRPQFRSEVESFSAEPAWITEWQYDAVQDLLADRADLLVWLDLPRAEVMRRVIRRTLRRAWRREVLWHGNREPGLHTVVVDRDHIIRWTWRGHPQTRDRVIAAARVRPDLPVVRLRRSREVDAWLAGPVAALSRR
jgi:adenylate kinase family enzyme